MGKIKVLTVVGTRPELIRLSRLIPLLDEFTEHVIVHTGQNYDPTLSDIFFRDLELRPPDYYLGIRGDSLGEVLGNLFPAIEEVLVKETPDAVAILGDTNSSLAAIIAERMAIPVYHMEAGNRSFDSNVPEELNRKLVDHVSSFNLAYSDHSVRNLLREGLEPRRVAKTGSPIKEIAGYFDQKIQSSMILHELGLSNKNYLLASLHRQENVDYSDRREKALSSLDLLGQHLDMPVVMTTHPRTRARTPDWGNYSRIQTHEPFGFLDYAKLQSNAFCVISDSGTISEESAVFDFPAVTIRDSIERPEALETGSIVMSGLDSQHLIDCVEFSTRMRAGHKPLDYEITDFSTRVLSFLLSTVTVHHQWGGIRRKAT
jgi:UDP-N-acetyl-L-fucosamine synthase